MNYLKKNNLIMETKKSNSAYVNQKRKNEEDKVEFRAHLMNFMKMELNKLKKKKNQIKKKESFKKKNNKQMRNQPLLEIKKEKNSSIKYSIKSYPNSTVLSLCHNNTDRIKIIKSESKSNNNYLNNNFHLSNIINSKNIYSHNLSPNKRKVSSQRFIKKEPNSSSAITSYNKFKPKNKKEKKSASASHIDNKALNTFNYNELNDKIKKTRNNFNDYDFDLFINTSNNKEPVKFTSNVTKALFIFSKSKIPSFEVSMKLLQINKELRNALLKNNYIENKINSFNKVFNKISKSLPKLEHSESEKIKSLMQLPSPMAIMTLFLLSSQNEVMLSNKELEGNQLFYEIVLLLLENSNITQFEQNEDKNLYSKFLDYYNVWDIKEIFITVIFPKVFKDNENENINFFEYCYSPKIMSTVCEKIKLLLEKYHTSFFWVEVALRQIQKKFEFHLSLNNNRLQIKQFGLYKKYLYLKSIYDNLSRPNNAATPNYFRYSCC